MAKHQARPKTAFQDQIDAARGLLPQLKRDWFRSPGVTAVDIGFRLKGGKLTNEIALRVHVERKLPKEALAKHELISESANPRMYGGFPVDVVQGSYVPSPLISPPLEVEPDSSTAVNGGDRRSLAGPAAYETLQTIDRRARIDPLVAGVSCGNPRVTAGTLGALVWDRKNCKPSILSNWHVLCGSPSCAAGEPILQPGVADGGTPSDKVAELTRWRLDKDADAALANLTGAREYTRDVIGLAPITGIAEPQLGMQVAKSGRTTGVTEGLIDGVHMTLSIDYGGGTVNAFQDQIRIVPLPPWPNVDYEVSRGGDSGSVWIEKATGKAIGLHFAGETDSAPSAEHGIANRMPKVAEILQFSFEPLFCTLPVAPVATRPVLTTTFVTRLRFLLCSRYPWLCGVQPRWQAMGLPTGAGFQANASACPQCGGGFEGAAHAPVDELIEEILAELSRAH